MSHDGDSASQPNDSRVPSDIKASDFSYFDEFPELLEDYPNLFGLSRDDWAMTVDQSILDTIEAQSDTTPLLQEPAQSTLDTIEAQSDTTSLLQEPAQSTLDTIEAQSTLDTIEAQSDTTSLLQEPAPPIQALPGPVYRSPYVDPACQKRPTWNCYRCDECGYTSTRCGQVSLHIRNRPDHDPQRVSASWVGDHNVKLARGFISGEIYMTRLQRVAGKYRERKGRNKKDQETQ
ncbi:hypothetical protein EV426DRAFT_709746 [Tirmania nivea]|nr:hypothetical protein EV426DRAFT_709746 [Tirmania nivea]